MIPSLPCNMWAGSSAGCRATSHRSPVLWQNQSLQVELRSSSHRHLCNLQEEFRSHAAQIQMVTRTQMLPQKLLSLRGAPWEAVSCLPPLSINKSSQLSQGLYMQPSAPGPTQSCPKRTKGTRHGPLSPTPPLLPRTALPSPPPALPSSLGRCKNGYS